MNRNSGLTLVELVVTLAVAIIVLGLGVPLFQSLQANNRAVAQTHGLVAALTLARSEAVTRAATVAVCARDGTAQDCGTKDQWADGWLVFVDENGNGDLDAADDELLRLWDELGGSPTVTFAQASVVFAADGTRTGGAATLGVRIHQEGAEGTQDRCVSITPTGQIRTVRLDAGGGGSCP